MPRWRAARGGQDFTIRHLKLGATGAIVHAHFFCDHDSGVVDQNVECAEFMFNEIGNRLVIARIGYIEFHGVRIDLLRPQFRGGGFRFGFDPERRQSP